MCGIVGVFAAPGQHLPDASRCARASARLAHRGPDDTGTWRDDGAGIWLGHRRLEVVGPGSAGAQPMVSVSGRYVLSYNGELYNFRELRRQLVASGHVFRGDSDTEVMLEVFARDGVERALAAFNGMFALALWDRERRELTLARDRFGEKPLYYAAGARGLLFASELKALRPLFEVQPEIDRAALALYLRYGYVPETHAIFSGIRKLPAASWLSFRGGADVAQSRPRSYWSIAQTVSAGVRHFARDDDAVDLIGERMADAVGRRLVADVPLGVFLSGGIDSSLVAAYAQQLGTGAARTFSIGFDVAGYDESAHAAAVARHLGTEHAEYRVDAPEAQAVIPALAAVYDEPFADSSQVPTLLVSRFARGRVTSVLTGDGGDEVFGGYVRYHAGLRAWTLLQHLPGALRRVVCRVLGAVPPPRWDAVFTTLRPLMSRRSAYNMPGDRLHKLARAGLAPDFLALYRELLAINPAAMSLMREPPQAAATSEPLPALPPMVADDAAAAMMFLDTQHYLPGDVLVKVDRAAMSASLETRAPFLDPALFAAAWSLPSRCKIRDGGKWVLRELLRRFLPPALYERPKMGFAIPLDSWLRDGLREWAGDLLSPARIAAHGYLDAGRLQQLWQEHQSGRRNHQHVLWSALMFEAWCEHESAAAAGEDG